MRIVSGILLAILSTTTAAAQSAHVDGYVRRDGVYVAPHYRSNPDHSYNNNWSVQPNYNPYTGRSGDRQPTWNDRPPESNSFGYGSQRNRNGYR